MITYIYYVYAYLRDSDNTPYYIGKGKNRRVYQNHPGISVPKDKSKIVFLERNLSNVGACALERRYIRWYGRKDLGTGILHNKTDGGEGGLTTTKEQQQIIWSNEDLIKRHSDIMKSLWNEERKLLASARAKDQWKNQNKDAITQKMLKTRNERFPDGMPHGGKYVRTDEIKHNMKMSALNARKTKIICEHCSKECSKQNYIRWHGDRCKEK